jgi:hypothetical protein
MKLTELPLDTWVVVEPTAANEVKLLSTHTTQLQAEAECDKRNKGLRAPRYRAIKTLSPTACAQGCAAPLMHR